MAALGIDHRPGKMIVLRSILRGPGCGRDRGSAFGALELGRCGVANTGPAILIMPMVVMVVVMMVTTVVR